MTDKEQSDALRLAAESVPAVEREQERIAFKDAHRHLELYEVPDAWGRPRFKHSHVEASWLGWIARASHGQAPASMLHLVHSAFAEIAMAFPKAFALHKVGLADTAVREALAAPPADSVLEDADRYRWLRRWKGQEHEPPFTVQHEIDGTLWGGDLDAAIDAAMNKGGAA